MSPGTHICYHTSRAGGGLRWPGLFVRHPEGPHASGFSRVGESVVPAPIPRGWSHAVEFLQPACPRNPHRLPTPSRPILPKPHHVPCPNQMYLVTPNRKVLLTAHPLPYTHTHSLTIKHSTERSALQGLRAQPQACSPLPSPLQKCFPSNQVVWMLEFVRLGGGRVS